MFKIQILSDKTQQPLKHLKLSIDSLVMTNDLLNQQYYQHDCLQNFLLLFCMSLSTTLILKNSHIFAYTYFIFPRKRCRPNLTGFQCQIWISVKRSRK